MPLVGLGASSGLLGTADGVFLKVGSRPLKLALGASPKPDRATAARVQSAHPGSGRRAPGSDGPAEAADAGGPEPAAGEGNGAIVMSGLTCTKKQPYPPVECGRQAKGICPNCSPRCGIHARGVCCRDCGAQLRRIRTRDQTRPLRAPYSPPWRPIRNRSAGRTRPTCKSCRWLNGKGLAKLFERLLTYRKIQIRLNRYDDDAEAHAQSHGRESLRSMRDAVNRWESGFKT